jgi:hypothetical protein
MPKRTYDGPCPSVELVLPDGNTTVARGESVEVPDDIAANLDEQGCWLTEASKPVQAAPVVSTTTASPNASEEKAA